MKRFLGLFFVTLLLLQSVIAYAEESTPDGKQLIEEALAYTIEVPFTTTYVKDSLQTTIYRQINKDGTTFERRDIFDLNLNALTKQFIKLPDGEIYEILNPERLNSRGITVINNRAEDISGTFNKASLWWVWNEQTYIDINYGTGKYSVTSGELESTPCWFVTLTMPYEREHIAKKLGISVNDKQLLKNEEMYKKGWIPTRVFTIGKEKPFIYSIQFYTQSGEHATSIEFGIPDFEAELPEELFELPDERVQVAKNVEGYKAIYRQAVLFPEALVATKSYKLGMMVGTWALVILLALLAVLITVRVVKKFKNR